jgi:metallo-beta-lactamase family protein
MKLKFCGAAREVTGSSHLITLDDGFTILLDCGLYQGPADKMDEINSKFLFSPRDIDCVVISHAHIDHTGRLPRLVQQGYKGLIYATHATRNLCSIMLMDSAKIQEADAERDNRHLPHGHAKVKPLYTTSDAIKTLQQFVSFHYEHWFQIHPDVRVLFRDAGHILGSASITLEIRQGKETIRLGYTGDIGRPGRPILGDPLPMPQVDFLICESTYGDRDHETAPGEKEHLLRIVWQTCVVKKGKLIIPAFSVGRTQEIVFMLDQLEHEGKLPRIQVYVDSPMAVDATDVFLEHPECFDADLHQYMSENENPFGFKGLNYVRSSEQSKKINHSDKPCIIIAASGMMDAGRVRHHLFHNIENHKATFLIVGYAAPYTPAGKLRNGEKSLNIMGQNKQVLADVEIMDSFSAHGDRQEMLAFLSNQKERCKNIWLTHGTMAVQENWKTLLLENGFRAVDVPQLGEEFTI